MDAQLDGRELVERGCLERGKQQRFVLQALQSRSSDLGFLFRAVSPDAYLILSKTMLQRISIYYMWSLKSKGVVGVQRAEHIRVLEAQGV